MALPGAVRAVLPILLGGWFVFVILSTVPGLLQRPIALRDADSPSFMDDFVVFYAAGRHAAAEGGGVYEPALISRLEAEATGQVPDQVVILPFFNPPPALLAFWPLGQLPVSLAAVIWLTVGVAVAAFLFRLLARQVDLSVDSGVSLFLLGIAASLPFYQAIVHGQMTFLLLGGFCLYCTGMLRKGGGAWILAGLLLLALKPIFLLFPLLLLAARRRFHLLAAFAMLEAALVVAATLAFGTRLPLDYISLSLEAIGSDEVNGISTYGMFGWTGFWRGIVGPDARELQTVLTIGSSVATVSFALWAFSASRERPLQALSVVVLASVLVSPHSYAQDLLLLCVPLLLLASAGVSRRGLTLAAALMWFALFFHFDLLDATGVGAANVMLIVLGAWVIKETISPARARAPVAIEAEIAERVTSLRRRSAFPSEAAGS